MAFVVIALLADTGAGTTAQAGVARRAVIFALTKMHSNPWMGRRSGTTKTFEQFQYTGESLVFIGTRTESVFLETWGNRFEIATKFIPADGGEQQESATVDTSHWRVHTDPDVSSNLSWALGGTITLGGTKQSWEVRGHENTLHLGGAVIMPRRVRERVTWASPLFEQTSQEVTPSNGPPNTSGTEIVSERTTTIAEVSRVRGRDGVSRKFAVFHAAEKGIATINTEAGERGQLRVDSLMEEIFVKNVGKIAGIVQRGGDVTVELAVEYPQLTNNLNAKQEFLDSLTEALNHGTFSRRVLDSLGRDSTGASPLDPEGN